MAKEKTPYQMLPINVLELNEGQLEGLPKNPRYIKDEEFQKLKKSIQDSPEFLEARMLLTYPLDNGKYIVIAGNMRLRACLELGFKELPCYVFSKDTPIEKLREYTIKDNANFGNWDFDELGNNWADDLDLLSSWGAPVDFLKQGDWDELPYIEEEQQTPEIDKPIKLTVTIPFEIKDREKEIKDLITETLSSYEGVTVS